MSSKLFADLRCRLALLVLLGVAPPCALILDAGRAGTRRALYLGAMTALVVALAWAAGSRIQRRQAEVERQLRALGARLTRAEEAERRRIAEELHDGIAQQLAASKLELKALSESASATLAESLNDVCELLEEAIGTTRTLTCDLRSPVLHQLGLGPALEQLGEQVHDRHGLDCAVEQCGTAAPLNPETRGILYRATKELLFNVVKHARAHKARVCLRHQGERVQVVVEDDGVGFAALANRMRPAGDEGFGLFDIRERLSFIGGTMQVDSRPGRGARVTLDAPVQQVETVP